MIHPIINLGCTITNALCDHYGIARNHRRTREHEHITSDGRHVLTITLHINGHDQVIANVPLETETERDDCT